MASLHWSNVAAAFFCFGAAVGAIFGGLWIEYTRTESGDDK